MEFKTDRSVTLIGSISTESGRAVSKQIEDLLRKSPEEEITLFISSGGGDLNVALSFYEMVRLLNINLSTVGLADISSSAVIVFLAGRQRRVTPGSVMLLHQGALTYRGEVSFSVLDLKDRALAMNAAERRYTEVLVQRTGLSKQRVQRMKARRTMLSAQKMVELGFAHQII